VRVSKEIPHRSHGEAVHRRRILADRRQEVSDINKRIVDRIQGKQSLEEIGKLLSPDDLTLSIMNIQEREQTRAELEIKQIWLQLKLGMITQEQQKQLLTSKFDELENGKADVYHWLVDNAHGPSRAQQIRDNVMPPIRVAGYYTKR